MTTHIMQRIHRKLSLFFLAGFVGMQTFSFLHMVEHGFEEHEHSGHVCAIYLHCEHIKYGAPDAVVTLQPPTYLVFATASPGLLFVRSGGRGAALSRAPPHFS